MRNNKPFAEYSERTLTWLVGVTLACLAYFTLGYLLSPSISMPVTVDAAAADDGWPVVRAVNSNASEAFQAQIQPDDVITQIGEFPTIGMTRAAFFVHSWVAYDADRDGWTVALNRGDESITGFVPLQRSPYDWPGNYLATSWILAGFIVLLKWRGRPDTIGRSQ